MYWKKPGEGTKIYYPTEIIEDENHKVEIGNNCSIGQNCFIGARKLVMMDRSEVCPGVIIGGGGDVILGEGSTIGFGAKLIPATFTTKGKYMNDLVGNDGNEGNESDMIRGSIEIGKGAYIGSGAVICISEACNNIKIGDFAVVGALTYIDKDVKPGIIVHPYKELIYRERHRNEK